MTKVLSPSTPPGDKLLTMIAKELDGVATPTARSPNSKEQQTQILEFELSSMKTPPDTPTNRHRAQQTHNPTTVSVGDPQAAGPEVAGMESAADDQPCPTPEPQSQLSQHALFINEEGKAQVRVFDTLEIRAAFLRCCNSSCRPDEMHRLGGQPPYMTPQQFAAWCKDLDLLEPSGPLSLMGVGVTFATRQEEQEDAGLSYVGFMDALMDLSLETGRNLAAQLQEEYRGWQAHFDEMRSTMLRCNNLRHSEPALGSASGTLRRSPSTQSSASSRPPVNASFRRSESLLSNAGRPLCGFRGGARMSEPGTGGGSAAAAQPSGRLSEGGTSAGRFTRHALFRQGGGAPPPPPPAAAAGRSSASRGSMRRSLTSTMSIRNSTSSSGGSLSPNPELPVNTLHAAALGRYAPVAPATPSPPQARLASARHKQCADDGDKQEALPQLPGPGEGRPQNGRPVGMPPKPMLGDH